ncbi:MAG: sugar ABC transporter substrate-binding protein [Spirochaetes bacterium]|nr:sugar ABC transporter substrate-binding protein [Spirochaetota bacterium]
MRRITLLPVCLFAMTAMIVMAAPSQETVAVKQVNLRFVIWGQPVIVDSVKESIAEFEKQNPNISVELLHVPHKYFQKLDAYIVSKTMPDIMRFVFTRVARYAKAGVLADLKPLMPPGFADDFLEPLLTAATIKGKLYASPWHTDTIGLFYNKEYLDRAGISPPKSVDEAWTWEEFMDVAGKAQQASNVKYGVVVDQKTHFITSVIFQSGASFFSKDFKRNNINSADGIRAIKFIADLHKSGLAATDAFTGITSANELFKTGSAVFDVTGSWLFRHFDKTITDFTWDVTYLFRGKQGAVPFGGGPLAIAEQSRMKPEAWKFVEFMTNKKGVAKIARDINFLPVRKSVAATIKYPQFGDKMKIFADMLPWIRERYATEIAHPAYSETLTITKEIIGLAVIGELTPEQAAKRLGGEIDKILKKYQ